MAYGIKQEKQNMNQEHTRWWPDEPHDLIREWTEDDWPREELLKHCERELNNADLPAIMTRSGSPGKSAVEAWRQWVNEFNYVPQTTPVNAGPLLKIIGDKRKDFLSAQNHEEEI